MGDQVNRDGTCLKWFDVRSFPAEPRLLVASSISWRGGQIFNQDKKLGPNWEQY